MDWDRFKAVLERFPLTRVTLGKSRVRDSCMPGSVRAKAEWLSYSTVTRRTVNVARSIRFCTRPVIALMAAVAFLSTRPALGTESCHGTYMARLMGALPSPALVDLVIHDDSPRNLRLAGIFMEALGKAGAQTGKPGSVKLELDYRLDRGASDVAGFNSGNASRFWNDPGQIEGGLHPFVPDTAAVRSLRERKTAPPNTLFVRAQLVQPAPRRVLWVEILQCKMIPTAHEEQLARDLGELVGASLGKAFPPQSF